MNGQIVDRVLARGLPGLVEAANKMGAEGLWVLRGAQVAALFFAWSEDQDDGEVPLWLAIPHETIVLIRFPMSDGGPPGLESF